MHFCHPDPLYSTMRQESGCTHESIPTSSKFGAVRCSVLQRRCRGDAVAHILRESMMSFFMTAPLALVVLPQPL